MADALTIGEVARRAGMATSALRYYERRGLIAPAGRGPTGRYYHVDVLSRLRLIDTFQRAGCTLGEIADLLASGRDWRSLARVKRAELEDRRRVLDQARALIDDAIACGCADLQACSADGR
jgi:MerR family transcriptional regulator, redox-sensitive transcriptional activator SoxR